MVTEYIGDFVKKDCINKNNHCLTALDIKPNELVVFDCGHNVDFPFPVIIAEAGRLVVLDEDIPDDAEDALKLSFH